MNSRASFPDSSSNKQLPRRIVFRIVIAFVLLGIVWWIRISSNKEDGPFQTLLFEGNTMSTSYSVKIVVSEDSPRRSKEVAEVIRRQLNRVNRALSRFHQGGELYRFNEHRNTKPFVLSDDILPVLLHAQQISIQTGGAFDVTVGPLIRLWGFHDKRSLTSLPSAQAIDAIKQQVGYEKLHIDSTAKTAQKQNPHLDVDLSAIAKGRAVDLIAEGLEGLGYGDFMVEVGGEVRCKGRNQRGIEWQIGIEKPVDENREISRIIGLSDMAMATSGDYRSFYTVNGKRLSHTIDPRTGRPITHNLASVTVLHSSCMTADAMATALTVLGPAEGRDFAEKSGLAAFFIARTADNGFIEFATAEFKKRVH